MWLPAHVESHYIKCNNYYYLLLVVSVHVQLTHLRLICLPFFFLEELETPLVQPVQVSLPPHLPRLFQNYTSYIDKVISWFISRSLHKRSHSSLACQFVCSVTVTVTTAVSTLLFAGV